MKTGLAYDLKDSVEAEPGTTDDALEEYDCAETVEILKASLEADGHSVAMLGGGREFLENVLSSDVEFVFNISEGRGASRSREAQVPAVLEMLGVPYSGSDPQCLAVSLDKPLTKQLVAHAGVVTPRWELIHDERNTLPSDFPFPAIVKPAYEGSSKGVRATSLVTNRKEAEEEVRQMLADYSQPVMIEEFIDGDEITVGLVGNGSPEVVGIMRILPRKKTGPFVYSLEVKRDWQNLVDYECPAELPEKTLRALKNDSFRAFEVLGCRDFSRVDFRLGPDGTPYFIEINPLPGLGTYSDLVIMALKQGWSHAGLIQAVFHAALKRYPELVCV